MKRWQVVCVAAGVVLAVCMAGLTGDREGRDRREGTSRVKFVKLVEKRVGERTYLGMVVRQIEGDKANTLLLPRKGDVPELARRLKEGQVVEIKWVNEEGGTWVTAIRPQEGEDRKEGDQKDGDRKEGRDGDKPKDRPDGGHKEGQKDRDGKDGLAARQVEELRGTVRKLTERLERLEVRVAELEKQNALLRKALSADR